MTGLDTNILIRYFTRDDSVQTAKVVDLIENRLRIEGPGYISLACTLETVWTLQKLYGFSREDTAQAIERMVRIEHFFVQNEREVYAAMCILRDGLGSFADALIAALGRWASCTTTYTFDKKASRIPGFTLLWPTP